MHSFAAQRLLDNEVDTEQEHIVEINEVSAQGEAEMATNIGGNIASASSGPLIFDMSIHDSAQRFDLSDGDNAIDLPQLSFMQALELGEDGRRDIVEGAFPSKKRNRINFDDSDGDEFEFGLTQVVGQQLPDDKCAQPEVQAAKSVKRRSVGKTAVSETAGFPTQPQVTKAEQSRLKGIEKERKRKQGIEDNHDEVDILEPQLLSRH